MTDSVAARRQSASSTSPARAIGDRDSHGESRHVGHGEPSAEHRDRYAAVIAALIDVRPDVATGRFDEELTHALADGRLDAQTARTLRWWQRASVRAAESYATAVVPEVLAARDRAEESARHDADEAGASWRAACLLAAAQLADGSTISAGGADDGSADDGSADDGSATEQGAAEQHEQTERPIVELAAIRLLQPARMRLRLAAATPSATDSEHFDSEHTGSEHTLKHTQAIRAAFAGEVHAGAEPIALNVPTDLVDTTVENQRKDRSHANPATSA